MKRGKSMVGGGGDEEGGEEREKQTDRHGWTMTIFLVKLHVGCVLIKTSDLTICFFYVFKNRDMIT